MRRTACVLTVLCAVSLGAAAAEKKVATLYVIGDSTAAPNAPDRYPRMGWAQVLQDYFDPGKVLVEDKAKGGRSSKSFLDEGSWAPVRDALKPGDYVFIQFGHNDSKKEEPARYADPDTTYRQFLKTYVDETRARGAVPVILTPINRNVWTNDGRVKDFIGAYPQAAREVALELKVPLIDLNALTKELMETLGQDKAKGLFMVLEKGPYPNFPDGAADNTHLQVKGAREICRLVVADIKTQNLPLAACVKESGQAPGIPAFPGAEGAGAAALGGRGGRVIQVTNLNDSGPGSLRDACAQEGPRTVVFRVSGLIDLKGSLDIKNGRVTVAGQTAPGNGICLRGGELGVEADDVVVRQLRVRPGDVSGREYDGISVSNSHRVVIDHCSATWSVDEALSVTGTSDAVTVQWCIIAEALRNSVHHKGAHSMGSLLRSEDGAYSFHHCLYAHNNTRNPRPGDNYDGSPGVLLDFRSNVVYDWGGMCGYGVDERFRLNYAGNFLKAGPSTKPGEQRVAFHIGGPGNRIFLAGNLLDGFPDADTDNQRLLAWPGNLPDMDHAAVIAPSACGASSVATQPARDAYAAVLEGAGATLPKRDAVDARIAQEVRSGGGRIIDSQREVGGWPEYGSSPAPEDRDGDGMPDAWETSHGLNPDDPNDGNADAGGGYTNLEKYLNSVGFPNAAH